MSTANKPTNKAAAAAKSAEHRHPLAGREMTGAEMVIQVLSDEGVDTIFGYSGGAILPTYDAIFRYNANVDKVGGDIRLIVPANEQGAGFMAAGYARSSGKVGVFLVTSGPGATNCVTPIRDCMADSIPVVLICGQVPRAAIGTDAFQEAPIRSIMSSCAKHCFLVKDEDKLEDTIRTAFELARSGRPGPVVIDIPKDVQNYVGKYKGAGELTYRGYDKEMAKVAAARVSKENAATFFKMLAESNRPLIYSGGGTINGNAAAELRDFAKTFGVPGVTTLMGIGSLDVKDDLCLHMLGMHGTAYANYGVEDCDMLIAIGSRFDDRVAGKVKEFAPNARHIAHIDIDAAEIGKVKAINWSFIGDAKTGLADLNAYGKSIGFKKDYSAWHQHVRQLKASHPMDYDKQTPLIQPYEAIELMSEITDGDAIITTGVGQHQMWAAQYFQYRQPRTWLTSGSMGTMGFGLPAAIGAAVANPGKTVVDVDGDGSIRMNIGELETAVNENIPVKVLLLNNNGDGMVRQWQKMMFDNRFSGTDKSLHKKDFVKSAEADGYKFAVRVSDRAQLRGAMEAFLKFEGPAFLEVMIDPDSCVWPMVGPGKGYKDMTVGPFIKGRRVEDAPKPQETGVKADLF